MSNNIVDAYYDRIKNNVVDYSTILINRAFRRKQLSKKTYVNIINHYIDDLNWNIIKISDDVDTFINDHNVSHFRLNNIINYTILYMDKENVRYNLEENADLIIKLAKMILVAVEIYVKTDVLINSSIKYANVLDEIIRQNSMLFDDDLKDRIKDVEKEIKEKIKANISASKKFLAKIKNNNFYLTFSNINDDYTLVKFNYEIKALNKYLKTDIEHQIVKKELNKRFTIIEAELLSILIMKWSFSRKEKRMFFIDIPLGFFQEQELVVKLIEKFSNKRILQYVCLRIKYSELLDNKEIVQELKNNYFKIAVMDAEKINEHKEHNTFNDLVDYLFGNEVLKTNNEYPREFCRDTNVKYIDETTCQAKYITEDRFMFS